MEFVCFAFFFHEEETPAKVPWQRGAAGVGGWVGGEVVVRLTRRTMHPAAFILMK